MADHEVKPTRSHGVLRGTEYVNKSSLKEARFGRMFRWIPGESYKKPELLKLALSMTQLENAEKREPPRSPEEGVWTEGPDIVFKATPLVPTPPDTNTLLDTPYFSPEPGDENPAIPAGYTYFGQFIDHDLTFDPNSSLQKQNDPDATEDFRTPRFDLDSVYGRGPDDQPYLYQDKGPHGGTHFLLGRKSGDPTAERRGELPRNVDGRALTGDPRNDENGIICQLQVVFLNFHNRVYDTLVDARPLMTRHERFQEAQRIVRWHYQYLVMNDYLPRVVGDDTWKAVYMGTGTDHPHPDVKFYKPKEGTAYMPIEFSVAAFRFGHSMVRPSYALRADDHKVGGSAGAAFLGDGRFHRIPIFSDNLEVAASMNGFGPLPDGWEIDWNLFFCPGEMPSEMSTVDEGDGPLRQVTPQTAAALTQPGYRIDTQLVDPLAMLPPDVAKSGNMPDGIPSLAYRNLLRGNMFALPSGQNVARALKVPLMEENALWADSKEADFRTPATNPFAFRAPLWFYILKEAEGTRRSGLDDAKGGHHLGPVGGRIVAEVLVGIALADHTSYLYSDPAWTPAKEAAKSGFDAGTSIRTMYELISWTTEGSMTFG